MRWILRVSEIQLKSKPVRKQMRKALERHLVAQTEIRGGTLRVQPWQGLIFADCDDNLPAAEEAFRHTFGLLAADPAHPIAVDPKAVAEAVREQIPQTSGTTFAVKCKRHGIKGEWTSQTFAAEVGSEILAIAPHLKVNLSNPEWRVNIALMPENAYLLGERIEGAGGLPTGVQGTVEARLENERDLLASWLVMRRGCRLKPLENADEKLVKIIHQWDPYLVAEKWQERLRTAPGQSHIGKVWGIVGDDLSGVTPQGDDRVPVVKLEPLVGWSVEELESLRIRLRIA